MSRKIIQIAVTNSAPSTQNNSYDLIVALCDDGSVWEIISGIGLARQWQKIPDIPQEAPDHG